MGPPGADLALCSLHQVARLIPTDDTLQVKQPTTPPWHALGRQGREPCARAPRQSTGGERDGRWDEPFPLELNRAAQQYSTTTLSISKPLVLLPLLTCGPHSLTTLATLFPHFSTPQLSGFPKDRVPAAPCPLRAQLNSLRSARDERWPACVHHDERLRHTGPPLDVHHDERLLHHGE